MRGSLLTQMRKIVVGTGDSSQHWWGGTPYHVGAVSRTGGFAFHHLMSLSVRDPLVSDDILINTRAIQPFLKTIPIYYAPGRLCDIQYIVSDQKTVKVLEEVPIEHFGCKHFAKDSTIPQMEKLPISLELIDYETSKLLGWSYLVNEFSLEMSPADSQKVRTLGYPFHQWGGFFPLLDPQCERSICLNRKCSNSGGELYAIGTLRKDVVPEARVWSLPDNERDFQMTISICAACPSVRTAMRVTLY